MERPTIISRPNAPGERLQFSGVQAPAGAFGPIGTGEGLGALAQGAADIYQGVRQHQDMMERAQAQILHQRTQVSMMEANQRAENRFKNVEVTPIDAQTPDTMAKYLQEEYAKVKSDFAANSQALPYGSRAWAKSNDFNSVARMSQSQLIGMASDTHMNNLRNEGLSNLERGIYDTISSGYSIKGSAGVRVNVELYSDTIDSDPFARASERVQMKQLLGQQATHTLVASAASGDQNAVKEADTLREHGIIGLDDAQRVAGSYQTFLNRNNGEGTGSLRRIGQLAEALGNTGRLDLTQGDDFAKAWASLPNQAERVAAASKVVNSYVMRDLRDSVENQMTLTTVPPSATKIREAFSACVSSASKYMSDILGSRGVAFDVRAEDLTLSVEDSRVFADEINKTVSEQLSSIQRNALEWVIKHDPTVRDLYDKADSDADKSDIMFKAALYLERRGVPMSGVNLSYPEDLVAKQDIANAISRGALDDTRAGQFAALPVDRLKELATHRSGDITDTLANLAFNKRFVSKENAQAASIAYTDIARASSWVNTPEGRQAVQGFSSGDNKRGFIEKALSLYSGPDTPSIFDLKSFVGSMLQQGAPGGGVSDQLSAAFNTSTVAKSIIDTSMYYMDKEHINAPDALEKSVEAHMSGITLVRSRGGADDTPAYMAVPIDRRIINDKGFVVFTNVPLGGMDSRREYSKYYESAMDYVGYTLLDSSVLKGSHLASFPLAVGSTALRQFFELSTGSISGITRQNTGPFIPPETASLVERSKEAMMSELNPDDLFIKTYGPDGSSQLVPFTHDFSDRVSELLSSENKDATKALSLINTIKAIPSPSEQRKAMLAYLFVNGKLERSIDGSGNIVFHLLSGGRGSTLSRVRMGANDKAQLFHKDGSAVRFDQSWVNDLLIAAEYVDNYTKLFPNRSSLVGSSHWSDSSYETDLEAVQGGDFLSIFSAKIPKK